MNTLVKLKTQDIKKTNRKLADITFWLGYWLQKEDWGKNGISEGTMILNKTNISSNSINGVAYNKNNNKVLLEGIANQKSFAGTWYNVKTNQRGNFNFEKNGFDTFYGNYELNGYKKMWTGQKFNSQFDYQINVSFTQSNELGFRTRALSKNELNKMVVDSDFKDKIDAETLIGVLRTNNQFKLIKNENSWFEILTIYKGELRKGYISAYFGGRKTYKKTTP